MIVDCSSLLPKTVAGEGQEEVKEWVMKDMGLSELEKPAKREEGEKELVEELWLYCLWVTRVSTRGMFSHSYIESPRTHILHMRLLQHKIQTLTRFRNTPLRYPSRSLTMHMPHLFGKFLSLRLTSSPLRKTCLLPRSFNYLITSLMAPRTRAFGNTRSVSSS
jgi:hypothetical protein